MSGFPRIRSMNVSDSETRPVLGPGGYKAQRLIDGRKPMSKPSSRKGEKSTEKAVDVEDRRNGTPLPIVLAKTSHSLSVPSVLRRHESLLHSNLSLSASCSSDASTDSFHSRASTGRICRSSNTSSRRKQIIPKAKNGVQETLPDGLQGKRRCAWVTASTDPAYVTFHDEEWGVPAHEDKKLFELLVLSGALAELTWPAILSKRHIFREVFSDFDPIAVAKLSEKKIVAPGTVANTLLSELKLRAIIENARQVSKVIDEFGSFDKYIWSFVNNKPIAGGFRYPRQVPVKTPKADAISKDLVRRGFRGVGPTVVYSFMQVAGITNDHLINCFRFHDCNSVEIEGVSVVKDKAEEKKANLEMESEICRSVNELNFSSE